MNFTGFVYKWTNTINGKWYIGSHKGALDDGYKGGGVLFRLAIKKYGIENFTREILYQGEDFRKVEEQYLLDLNAAKDSFSYNMKNSAMGHAIGEKLTEEVCIKISNSHKGISPSLETRKKQSLSMTGRTISDERKQHLRILHKGRVPTWLINKPLTKEHKEKIGGTLKGRVPWNKGKHGYFLKKTIEKLNSK